MKSISGLLIKYHRERLDIPQKQLCKDICVISHLSKIENGKVDASDHIVKELFRKLNIDYNLDNNFLEE